MASSHKNILFRGHVIPWRKDVSIAYPQKNKGPAMETSFLQASVFCNNNEYLVKHTDLCRNSYSIYIGCLWFGFSLKLWKILFFFLRMISLYPSKVIAASLWTTDFPLKFLQAEFPPIELVIFVGHYYEAETLVVLNQKDGAILIVATVFNPSCK